MISLAFWRTSVEGGSKSRGRGGKNWRRTIRALVLAVLVDVLELLQRLDDIHVFPVVKMERGELSCSAPSRGRPDETHRKYMTTFSLPLCRR